MRVTWKDGVTALATAGVVVLERAHFHNWDIPLISSVRWATTALVVLGLVSFIFGYMLDEDRSPAWSVVAAGIGIAAAVLAFFGLVTASADFVVLLMLAIGAFWLASLLRHLVVPAQHSHA